MADTPVLTIHTDGASRGNPGDAAYAYVISREGSVLIEEAGCLGQMTNNQAEYTALVRALEHALEMGAEHRLLIYSDSELMVKQMKGEYRVKNEELRELYEQARNLTRRFQGQVLFQHVRRAHNTRADALCNEVLDGKRPGSGRCISPTTEAAPPGGAVSSLHDQALSYLRQASAAWMNGAVLPTPEEVWRKLVTLLRQHGVALPS
jgi:ribonuclease HI